jgi:hypothetical protein
LRKLHFDIDGLFLLLSQKTAKLAAERLQSFGHFFELKLRELGLERGKRGIELLWAFEAGGP